MWLLVSGLVCMLAWLAFEPGRTWRERLANVFDFFVNVVVEGLGDALGCLLELCFQCLCGLLAGLG